MILDKLVTRVYGRVPLVAASSPRGVSLRNLYLYLVSQFALEFDLVMKVNDSLDSFSLQWEKYENAIVSYCKAGSRKPAYLQQVLDSTDEDDPGKLASYYGTAGNYRWCKISRNRLLATALEEIFMPSPRRDHTQIDQSAILRLIFSQHPTYPQKRKILHHTKFPAIRYYV
jgi:hypothetical protein